MDINGVFTGSKGTVHYRVIKEDRFRDSSQKNVERDRPQTVVDDD